MRLWIICATFASMNEIIIDHLAIGYPHKLIAKDLTWHLKGGELTCLIGRNGTGKSTLLRTMAGFLKPLQGSVTLCTDDHRYNPVLTDRHRLARLVSVVLTNRISISHTTVADLVAMGRMPYTGYFGKLSENDWQMADKAMDLVGITDFKNRDISTLSDGERQKAMIARALAQATPFFFLDEPTAFLDYDSKCSTMTLLHRLAHNMGKVIVLSSHDLDIVKRTADRIISLPLTADAGKPTD